MGFNKNVVAKVRNEYSEKYRRAQLDADYKRDLLHTKIAGLAKLDRELSFTGIRIMEATMAGGADIEEKINKIKKNNDKLLAERATLLKAYGYPEDYTDVHYECDKCGDTGFVDSAMCDCMKKALVMASYESSGLGNLMKSQSFENFSLDYYLQSPTVYGNMKYAYEKVKSFAHNFNNDTYMNFLFIGGTGLGKTHLSTAVAKTVIDRHFDVLYVTAAGMIGDFEYRRFGNSAIEGDAGDTSRYYSADLLIIDDLGTEINNQFTVSCIYDIINSRIISRKSTIISTNLTNEEISKRYWDRITSRVFGEYVPLIFGGTDIRRQKIARPRARQDKK